MQCQNGTQFFCNSGNPSKRASKLIWYMIYASLYNVVYSNQHSWQSCLSVCCAWHSFPKLTAMGRGLDNEATDNSCYYLTRAILTTRSFFSVCRKTIKHFRDMENVSRTSKNQSVCLYIQNCTPKFANKKVQRLVTTDKRMRPWLPTCQ